MLIAADAGVSTSAVNRHRRNHLRPELRAQLSTRTATHVSDYADQLAELADDANSVREFARTANNPDLLLRAVQSKRDTLLTLTNQLGIESTETVETLREAWALARACAEVLPRHPDALAEILSAIRDREQHQLAEAIAASVGAVHQLVAPEANRPPQETP